MKELGSVRKEISGIQDVERHATPTSERVL
jgi:hypothetical protein